MLRTKLARLQISARSYRDILGYKERMTRNTPEIFHNNSAFVFVIDLDN